MPNHHELIQIVNSDTLFWISVRKQENRVDGIQHFQNLFCTIAFNKWPVASALHHDSAVLLKPQISCKLNCDLGF